MAEAEERLARRARGRRLLAHAAQVQAGRLHRATLRSRSGEAATTWSIAIDAVGMRRARAAGTGRVEIVVGSPSSSRFADRERTRRCPAQRRGAGGRERPGAGGAGSAAAGAPARARRRSAARRCRSARARPRRRSRAPPSCAGSSASVSSSIVGAGNCPSFRAPIPAALARAVPGDGRRWRYNEAGVNATPEPTAPPAQRPPPHDDPRDLLHEPVDRGDGQHDRERGAAVDPPRPARVGVGAAVDDRRVCARDRELASAVRLDRRSAGAQAHLPGRAARVRGRLAAVQPRPDARLADRGAGAAGRSAARCSTRWRCRSSRTCSPSRANAPVRSARGARWWASAWRSARSSAAR